MSGSGGDGEIAVAQGAVAVFVSAHQPQDHRKLPSYTSIVPISLISYPSADYLTLQGGQESLDRCGLCCIFTAEEAPDINYTTGGTSTA